MKDKYQVLEVSILSTYLYKSLILVNGINLILNLSKLNTIISIIIGSIIGFLILNLYLRINSILPKYDIFEKIDIIYNKIVSIIIKSILIVSIILLSSYLLRITTSFIKFNYADTMTIEIISILYVISLIYIISKSLSTIVRTSVISIGIIVFLELITILFSISNINSSNLLPLIIENFNNTIFSAFDYIILSVIPLFLLLIIPKNSISNNKYYNKNMRITYIVMSIYNIFNIILTLSIININLIELIPYPNTFILSKINVLNFFDRMENILSFKYLIDSFITLSLCLYYIKIGIFSFYNKTNKYISYIIGIIIYITSIFFTINIKYILILLTIFLLSNLPIIFHKQQ